MEEWRRKLHDLLEGKTRLFEEDYRITYRCKYKTNGMWVEGKIDFKNKEIVDRQGNILRRDLGI
ncbi:hypothetical protein KPL26_03190 [Clostridium algidicarnis]|uniref:hypothetical protein n=1 Tax=Clostridium algidicarnis TaxID=37659 RepID=UPI001C0C358B|nr:hypothetical protein [Clostridium algidicarnis]MBU3195667.1 hypothetical protein [Clostridium algidicarnis]